MSTSARSTGEQTLGGRQPLLLLVFRESLQSTQGNFRQFLSNLVCGHLFCSRQMAPLTGNRRPAPINTRITPFSYSWAENYCGNCLIPVTWSQVKRTKTVREGGWP